MTLAPSAANAIAMPRPIPELEPVISATLSCSLPIARTSLFDSRRTIQIQYCTDFGRDIGGAHHVRDDRAGVGAGRERLGHRRLGDAPDSDDRNPHRRSDFA